jgi:ATP-dependent helicase/nuclease subunit B
VELTVDGVTFINYGFVDRVDGWVKDGKLYLRVVDYKTGKKTLDLTEIWNGIGLQMLLYLFTLERKGISLYNICIVPAGVLYLPARDVVVQGSRGMSEEERRRAVDQELRRRGLLLDDPEVLGAMEVAAGSITADPYWRGPERNACLYCDFAAACHFEEGRGDDKRRWLPTVKNQEFWSRLEENETE